MDHTLAGQSHESLESLESYERVLVVCALSASECESRTRYSQSFASEPATRIQGLLRRTIVYCPASVVQYQNMLRYAVSRNTITLLEPLTGKIPKQFIDYGH